MPGNLRPSVYTIPAHRPFADALAAGLIARHGRGKMGLAEGIILVPNNRAARTIGEAFLRCSNGGLLLPRLIPIGDPELDERIGGALDPMDDDAPIPPAVEPVERLLLLAGLIQQNAGDTDAAEALRLAQDLARTLDQLLIERVDPARLMDFATDWPDLSLHWQKSLDRLQVILAEWPALLKQRGRIDLVERRNLLLDRMAQRWQAQLPAGFVVAAGITTAAPAVAGLLCIVSRLPNGMVVLPALDTDTPREEWDALGPHDPDPDTGRRMPSIETHPQFHLKILLDRMGIGRGEVERWRWGGGSAAPAARGRAIAHAMAPPLFTAKWQKLQPAERRLSGVRALELADPPEEAQAIAIALREALEKPGRTAALITPDRGLARRVAAHLHRWGIEADDSAGRPLSETPSGTFVRALAEAAAQRFAPVALLAVLKHPLAMKGEARLAWLEGVRRFDLALRSPRPAAGLAGISDYLTDQGGRDGAIRAQALDWWQKTMPLLKPLESAFQAKDSNFSALLTALREVASVLSADQVWTGSAGREFASLFAALEEAADHGPSHIAAASVAPLLEQLMADVAVRPPYGQHPRIFIWGLLEARLQHADLMILGGLNEGTWPALPAPDPWLAPRIRAELGLPGLERRIGLAAHDFASALGGREVLVSRARRDERTTAVASRFWLRLEAMTGGLTRSPHHRRWARALDRMDEHRPARRPAPAPDKRLRPRTISVTEVDRLKADPFAFYARKLLRLSALDAVDADPGPAWRGSAVHFVLESWMKEDGGDPARLLARAEAFLERLSAHPLLVALWQPRLIEAIEWIAAEVARNRVAGRVPVAAEISGEIEIAQVTLRGKADRIDQLSDGTLAIVDYKTGAPPGSKAVGAGFAMQLGLLGLIAEQGGFPGLDGAVAAFEYWSLARASGKLGYVASLVAGRSGLDPADFTRISAQHFTDAAGKWLTGDTPYTAKLHPEYAPYDEYDQLMRLDEWYGRED